MKISMNVLRNLFITTFVVVLTLLGNDARSQNPNNFRLTDGWEFVKGDLGGVWEAVRIVNSSNLPVWESVQLPHSYNALDGVDPDVTYYQGQGWYRTFLNIENPYENGRVILHFEGAGQVTDVYVFQTKVGRHIGGYDESSFDITDAVADFLACPEFGNMFDGNVPVVVRTDNSRNTEFIPSDLSDFNLYGGLYRNVNLMYLPPMSVDMLHIKPITEAPFSQATIKLNAKLYNPYNTVEPITLQYEISDPNNKVVASGETKKMAWTSFMEIASIEISNPVLWHTNSPQLYTCKFTLISSNSQYETVEKFGIRHFEFKKNGPFHLNGERLFIQGTHRHEDHAGVGPAMTEEMMRTEMELMKEMGVNFLRTGHYQQSRTILELCDELGILVWEEIPWCRGGLGGEGYKEQARRMLTNMIHQHYNHPSVIIWGLGNENDWPGDFDTFDEHEIRAFMQELHDLSHALDDTRKTGIRRADFLSDVIDVYSPSIWAGWYRGIYQDYTYATQKWIADVDHFFHMEWGGSSHPGRFTKNPEADLGHIQAGATDERDGDFHMTGGLPRASRDGIWCESYIANLFDWHPKEMEKMPNLTGAAQWPFKDFSTPLRPENPIPYINQKGVVQRDFTKKESFYIFQSYWTEKPMAHIFGHAWTTRWGQQHEDNEVKVYSNCKEAELFVNGKSMGVKQRNSDDFPAAGLRWMVRYKEGENHLRVLARKGDVEIEDAIIINYQTQEWSSPSNFRLQSTPVGKDTVEVLAILLDENAVLCLDATNRVEFGLTGDGKLIDNLGTAKGSRTLQLANGRARIRVKLNKGNSVISISSQGIPTAFLNLEQIQEKANEEPVKLGNLDMFAKPEKTDVLNYMNKVADWQLENLPEPKFRPGGQAYWYKHFDWTNASFYTGLVEHWKTTKDQKYLDWLMDMASEIEFQPGTRLTHADDHVIGQIYADLYFEKQDKSIIEPIISTFDQVMQKPITGRELWWWCDALYMAPPTLAMIYQITGEIKYLDYLDKLWWDVYDFLYDEDEHLFYRDTRFVIKNDGSGRREADGSKVFWSRGNGWVLAGLVRVLEYMPKDYPTRPKYEKLYKEMAAKITALQQDDGLWKSSMLYPDFNPNGESSGSAFFAYALMWGVNNGLIDQDIYVPYILRTWNGLVSNVHADGKLGWTQQIGYAPDEITEDMSEVYGAGAFLLAGSELIEYLEFISCEK
jgi:beta-galactosidase